jgi:choline dehydrogenase-like flavoprotein
VDDGGAGTSRRPLPLGVSTGGRRRPDVLVVGSGPAGVAATVALLQRGVTVLMVDGGEELAPARRHQVAALRATAPDRWDAAATAFLRDGTDADLDGIPEKRSFGSDHPYRLPSWHAVDRDGAAGSPSLARGGLSTVWGAAMLPYRDPDLVGWPIDAAALAPHYRAVLDFVPMAATGDALAAHFPLHDGGRCRPLPATRQASALLAAAARRRRSAQRRGLTVGRSRLAVHPADASGGAGCVRCRLCLVGCPLDLIWSATHTVANLSGHPRFSYQPGVVVERVFDVAGGAVAEGRTTSRREPIRLHAGRVLLACGPMGSTRVLLASLEAWDQPVVLRDSAYWLLPLVRAAADRDAADEPGHALAQAFVELDDRTISPHTVHLQLYTYSDLMRGAAQHALGPLARLLGGAVDRHLLTRLVLVQGYLHSVHSGTIEARLGTGADGRAGPLRLTGRVNPQTARVLRRVVRRLVRAAPVLGAVPAAPLLRLGEPGRGYHSGGSFPMSSEPGRFETDRWGRPTGLERVHVVDSTTFPSIPATTITLTVMANAHRIASELVA